MPADTRGGHQRGRAAVERERRRRHASEANRDQVLEPARIRFAEQFDRIAAAIGRPPSRMRLARRGLAPRLAMRAALAGSEVRRPGWRRTTGTFMSACFGHVNPLRAGHSRIALLLSRSAAIFASRTQPSHLVKPSSVAVFAIAPGHSKLSRRRSARPRTQRDACNQVLRRCARRRSRHALLRGSRGGRVGLPAAAKRLVELDHA